MQDGRPNIVAHSIFGPIIVNSNDEFIAKAILQTGAWALFEVSIVERIIEVILTRKNKVAFYDVGANFGCRCRIFPPEELSSLFDGRRSHLPSRRPGYWIPPGTRVLTTLSRRQTSERREHPRGCNRDHWDTPESTMRRAEIAPTGAKCVAGG
jgi:hypothetical protein